MRLRDYCRMKKAYLRQNVHYDVAVKGDYVATVGSRLQGIKGGDVHTPWTLSNSALSRAQVSLNETLPFPCHHSTRVESPYQQQISKIISNLTLLIIRDQDELVFKQMAWFLFSLVHQQKEGRAHLTHQDNTRTEGLTSTSPIRRVSEEEM